MKKYLLIALLLFSMTLVVCSSKELNDTDGNNPVSDHTEAEVPDDTDELEIPAEDNDKVCMVV